MDADVVPYEWWRAVLDLADEAVVIIGKPYRLVDVNDATVVGLNSSRAALLGAVVPDAGGATPARQALAGEAFEAEVLTERVGPNGVRAIRQRTLVGPDGEQALVVMLDRTEAEAVRTASQQQRKEIDELGEQLHRLAGELVQARDDERAAVARALHDDTLQRLAALRWELAGDEELAEQLAACYEAVREVITRVRAEPVVGDHLGEALDELAGRAPVACSMRYELRGVLPAATADVVWRAVREAIRAAVLRRASHIAVFVSALDGTVLAEIRDDGAWSQGGGVANVRRLVRSVGGRVTFRRRDGGATVTVMLGRAREGP